MVFITGRKARPDMVRHRESLNACLSRLLPKPNRTPPGQHPSISPTAPIRGDAGYLARRLSGFFADSPRSAPEPLKPHEWTRLLTEAPAGGGNSNDGKGYSA